MTAPTKSVSLAPELAEAVDAAVAAGEYGTAAEAVGEAVREWAERRDNYGYTIEELRELIQEGIDSGPSLDGEEVLNRLRDKYLAIERGEDVEISDHSARRSGS